MSLDPGAVFAGYQVVEEAGRGGMAAVYKAFDPRLRRYVAIKVLPAFFAEQRGFPERFQQEAIAVAGLRHPNILAVFDAGEAEGTSYIVTEYVEGGTLAEQLGAALPIDYVARILAPVASALDYAHARGVLHRDVKPSNILLRPDATPVLGDFGLAQIVGSLPRLTATGGGVGTPEYMAPEQASDEAGSASDQYSLAVVAYEMLTGQVPYAAATPMATLAAHLQKPVPPPTKVNPSVPPSAEAALLKALAKQPGDRYRFCAEFISALQSSNSQLATQVFLATQSPAERSAKDLLAGRYEIQAAVHESKAGELLRAWDTEHERLVALKAYRLSPAVSRDDLRAEAKTLFAIQPHSGLVTVRDSVFVDDRYVIVMDWVEGVDLGHLLAERGDPGLTPSAVLEYVSQAASAIDHLHRHQPPIVHGDIKPSNLILTSSGRVVLVDFGIAATSGARGQGASPGFTAPEVAAGGPLTPAADIYSLGATAVALLTGQTPGAGSPSWEGIEADQVGSLARVLRQTLATDPARRHSSAGELAERLRGARPLPSGVVTFLATEVADAASLWNLNPDAMAAATARLGDLVAACVEEHGGYAARSLGEENRTLCSFASASAAASAAHQLHQRVQHERWPGKLAMRLRIGLHSGEATPRDGTYMGATVMRAAHLRDLAEAGRTVVSTLAVTLVGSQLPDGIRFIEIALDDDLAAEKVFQLVEADEEPMTGPTAPAPPGRVARPVLTRADGQMSDPSARSARPERSDLEARLAEIDARQREIEKRLREVEDERRAVEIAARQTEALTHEKPGSGRDGGGLRSASTAERLRRRLAVLEQDLQGLRERLRQLTAQAGEVKAQLSGSVVSWPGPGRED